MTTVSAVARPQTVSDMRRASKPEKPEDVIGEVAMSGLAGGALWTAGTGSGVSILAHEAGHATAANLLYVNAHPHISITPLKGGVTSFDPSHLSTWGNELGRNLSNAVVSAAGPAVDVVTSMAAFAVGYKMRKEHKILGPALMGYGSLMMLNDTLYAASAVSSNVAALAAKGNDFAGIATALHIHPIIPALVMASLIPLEFLALRHMEKH